MESSWIFTCDGKFGVKVMADPAEDLAKLIVLRRIFEKYPFTPDERILCLKFEKKSGESDEKQKQEKGHKLPKKTKNINHVKNETGCIVIGEDKSSIFVLCTPDVAINLISKYGISSDAVSMKEIDQMIKSGKPEERPEKAENKEEEQKESKEQKTEK